MTMRPRLAEWLVPLVLVSPWLSPTLRAAPPVLRELAPSGGQRGRTVEVALLGDHLSPDLELISTLPGKVRTIPPEGPKGPTHFRVELPADAQPGYYPVRVRTADGLSAPLIFAVGEYPENTAPAGNDDPARAAELRLPITVNGHLNQADRRYFQFPARTGERWSFEVEARRLGSGIDPLLHLSALGGRELAAANDTAGLGGDCRLDFTAPKDGTYLLTLQDYTYRGQGAYRLKAGQFASPAALFPLGGPRNHALTVTQMGGNLATPVPCTLTAHAPAYADRTAAVLAAPLGPAVVRPFAVSDLPEFLEPAESAKPLSIHAPAVINGTVSRHGEVDRYPVRLPPGKWRAGVEAVELGSTLDPLLTILVNGTVAAKTNEGVAPRVTFTVPPAAKDVVVSVEDLHRRGGVTFGYRLKIEKARPDYRLRITTPLVNLPRGGSALVRVQAERLGFAEPIQLSVEGPPGVQARGGLIPAGGTEGTLLVSADGDADLRAGDLHIWGNGGNPASPLRRRARGAPANISPWVVPEHATELPMAMTRPLPVQLAWEPTVPARLAAPFGTDLLLPVKVVRKGAEAESPIVVESAPPPASFSLLPITIDKGKTTGVVKLMVREVGPGGGRTPLGARDVYFTGKMKIEDVEREIPLPPLAVDVVAPFQVELLTPELTLAPGGTASLPIVVRRVAPFDSPVTVRFDQVPKTFSVGPLPPITGNFATVPLTAAADAKPGEEVIVLRAKGLMKARSIEYDSADVNVRVKIVPPPSAGRTPGKAAP
jgi:hypothetical protein